MNKFNLSSVVSAEILDNEQLESLCGGGNTCSGKSAGCSAATNSGVTKLLQVMRSNNPLKKDDIKPIKESQDEFLKHDATSINRIVTVG